MMMSNSNQLVIVDTSVIAHLLHHGTVGKAIWKAVANGNRSLAASILRAQLGWLESGQWANLQGKPDVIWALDIKINGRYWRHDYLIRSGIAYKGGRQQSPSSFGILYDTMQRILLSKGSKCVGVAGYEADDVAAAAVQTLPHKRKTLLTIDNDWAGLIGENGAEMVTAVSTHKPRRRSTLSDLNEWAAHRLKTTFTSCREIWQYKAEKGDPSDNLPPGTPIEVIDLINPPDEYNLKNNEDLVQHLAASVDPTHRPGAECREYLNRQGLPLAVSPLTPVLC